MEFDKNLFELSLDACDNVKPSKRGIKKDVYEKQQELLKILFERFKEELKSKDNVGDGIVKAKFNDSYYSDFSDGYHEIDELVRSNNFHNFASEYCMYISNVSYRFNEFNIPFYEITWDFKSYFDELKTYDSGKNIINKKRKQQRESKQEKCIKKGGHDFGEWKECTWTTTEEYDEPSGPSRFDYVFSRGTTIVKTEHIKWTRRCKNCGKIETTYTKPSEIEAKEIEEQIKTLQRKLDSYKK